MNLPRIVIVSSIYIKFSTVKNGNRVNITISLSSGITKQGSNSLTRVLFGQSQGIFLAILGDKIDIGWAKIIGF